MQHNEFKLPTLGLEKTCDKCGHLSVCMIHRAFSPLIRKEFEDDAPIEPVDLAKICKSYISAEMLRLLEEEM